MFNFDVYSGWQNFKTSGTVRVSVSDGFTNTDLRSPAYSRFYNGLVSGFTGGEVYWDATMLAGIQDILAIYNQFANLDLVWIGDFDAGGDGTPNPEDVGRSGLSDINITWIYRSDVGFAGVSGGGSDSTIFRYVGGAGDIFLNAWALTDTSLTLNTSSRQILMHELGHSFGLSHPHTSYLNGVPTISADYAATQFLGFDKLGFRTSSAQDMYKEYFSIMSYDDTESFLPGDDTVFYAHTPMILDVIALQQAYGAGAGTHGAGDDVIQAGTAGYRTYFDVGGIDTIDLTMYSSGAYLHMGTSITDAEYLVGVAMSTQDARLTIAQARSPANLRWFYGSYENVIGGAADDWIIGNHLDNVIFGGAGQDLMTGGGGQDVFSFAASGNGIDTITDFEIGDVLRIAGANFASAVTLGDGASLGMHQVQIAPDRDVTRLHVGTDAMLGADITIVLSGLFSAGQFVFAGDSLGLQALTYAEQEVQEQEASQMAQALETQPSAPGSSPSPPAPVFVLVSNGMTRTISPEVYTGLLDLAYQLIDDTANAVVFGTAMNDFLKLGGTGNKAVDGGGGADVIDGGTGSTFMSGGGRGDADTFFLDGRASGVTWSTITDFELGLDKATIWGWKQGVSRVSHVFADFDMGGAEGFMGLTLHFEHLLPDGAALTERNENLNSITLSNLTLADFGATSIDELNAQIASGTNPHFMVGSVADVYGEHGYLYIS
jgi:Ca2+-binding RTX toxin-like protein